MTTTQIGILEGHFDPNIPQILPHDRMYNIQIGTKLFKISGASLSSDGPSYFTNYFIKKDAENRYNNQSQNNQNMTTTTSQQHSSMSPDSTQSSSNHGSPASTTSLTSLSGATPRGFHTSNFRQSKDILFIDRSPAIFELIYQHLQGYFINIHDEVEYTMLISDAVYYNLPRLKVLLKKTEYYYTKIGDRSFKFPKDFLRKNGDTQNYFQITSESLYVDVENLILAKKLLRPPPHSYSYVPRSPEYFEMILNLLCGDILQLSEELRESLIKECKFYRFLNLEQRLIKCKIDYNPMTHGEEICLKLDKIFKKGLIIPEVSTLRDMTRSICIDINRMLSFAIFPINNQSGNTKTNKSITHSDKNDNNNNNNNNSMKDNRFNNDLTKSLLDMPRNSGLTPGTENLLSLLKNDDIDNNNNNNDDDDDDDDSNDFMNLHPLKKQKIDRNDILNLSNDNSSLRDDTIWKFMDYKRPFIDDYSRELNFQMDNLECTLIFNKLERMICLDIVGENASKFESIFGPCLLRTQGINLQDYKITTPHRGNHHNIIASNNNQSNSMRTREILTNINNHLIIPVCLSISDTRINGQQYNGNFTEFFENCSENVLDIVDMTRTPRYTIGSHLYLTKSVWKLAIDATSKSIVLLAIKLDAFDNIRALGRNLEYL